MIRSILAVVTGFVVVVAGVMAASWGVAWVLGVEEGAPSTAYLVLNVTGSALAAVVGGFTAAVIAGRRGFIHAFALALILVVLGLVEGGADYVGRPSWYPVAIGILGPLGALLGGLTARARVVQRERRAKRKAAERAWAARRAEEGAPGGPERRER